MNTHRGEVEGISWLRRNLRKLFPDRDEGKDKYVAVDMEDLKNRIWLALKACPVFEIRRVVSDGYVVIAWGMSTLEYTNPQGSSEWEIKIAASACGTKLVGTVQRGSPRGVVPLCEAVCPGEIKLIFSALFLELSRESEA